MTDDWLKEIDNKKMVGAVLLDFRTTFNIIDHSLLLDKRMCYGFTFFTIGCKAITHIWCKSFPKF
jgi:hypothetical protein